MSGKGLFQGQRYWRDITVIKVQHLVPTRGAQTDVRPYDFLCCTRKNWYSRSPVCAPLAMTLEFAQIKLRHGGRICFADKILALSRTSNLDQNCAFEQFKSEPKFHVIGIKMQWRLFFSKIYDHVSRFSFGPLSNCSNVQFCSRFEVRLWTKISSSKQIQRLIWVFGWESIAL